MRPTRTALLAALILPLMLAGIGGNATAFCEILEPPSPVPTQVNGTQVEIQLTEGFARIVIIKEFYNPSPVLKEGQVFFPLERGHELITDLRLKIGNVVFNSTVQDRGEALGSFLDALAKGQDAALVQYDPPRDVYWVAVTIPPFSTRTTVTTLEMPLTKIDGYYQYHYRLSVDARDSKDYLRVRILVATSAPLEHVGVHSHPDVPIRRSGDRIALADLNSTEQAGARDLAIHFRTSGTSLAQATDSDGEHRFVRFAVDAGDPAFADSIQPEPRAFLLLVDASGSMGLEGRWDFGKAAVFRILEGLGPTDTFGLAAFQGPTHATFRPGLESWSSDSRTDAERFLAGIVPRGSTGLSSALPTIAEWARQARARGQQPVLFLVTDGRATRGDLGLDLENAFKRVSFDQDMPMFGLVIRPRDHSDENLIRNLTHYNRGASETVYGVDVQARVASILAAVRVPVLEGLRASLTGAVNLTLASADPQFVWQGGEAVVIARMRGSPSDPLSVGLRWTDPDGAAREIDATHAGDDVPFDPLLKRQWVLARIHRLLERISAHAEPAVIDDLKAFGTAHRVVTPYTSLLVLIPREEARSDGPAVDGSRGLFDEAFGGGFVQSSPGSFGRPAFLGPLEREASRADALRRDLLNPLVLERETDRLVVADSPEYISLNPARGIPVFEGTYLRILELDDQLVLIVKEWPDVIRAENGVGATLVVLAMFGFAEVRRVARRERDPSSVRFP